MIEVYPVSGSAFGLGIGLTSQCFYRAAWNAHAV